MAGFTRRFGNFPGVEQLTFIEGVNIIDLPPPGSIQGVGTGTVALVGEYPDMGLAVSVDGSGNVATKPQPTEIFSGQDMLDKFGGFDSTIGDFGTSDGNAFVAARNKKFSRLIGVAINLCSAKAIRVWRKLPTNVSATNPSPVIPMTGAVVSAAREFRAGTSRALLGTHVAFTDDAAYRQGVDGRATAAAAAATQTFTAGDGGVLASITTVVAGIVTITGLTDMTAAIVGRKITISGAASANNNGTFTIVSFLSATSVTYANNAAVAADANNGAIAWNTGPWVESATKIGDILVIGVISAAGAQGDNADTYRVVSITTSRDIVVEKMDGGNFAFTTGTLLAWRIHVPAVADSGGNFALLTTGGFTVPARPLDATISDSLLQPTLVPPAPTATSWDPLSGLTARTQGGVATLVYTAGVQAVNAASSAALDALYVSALDALLTEELPARDVNIIFCARRSSNIRNQLKQHVLTASATGLGHTAHVSPELTIQTLSAALADADPGVGANRAERIDYNWPGALTFVPEAVGFSIMGADGKLHTDGLVDTAFDGWNASVNSVLPPERNPGEATGFTAPVLAGILGLQRGAPSLGLNEYGQMRQKGIAGLRIDRNVGPIIQSGITTSLVSGEKNQNRRRMADFIEDSAAARFVQLAKQPLTNALKDELTGELVAFLNELLSPNNPAAQRISSFLVDDKSGNTPALEAKGIFVLIAKIRTLATADFITLQVSAGEGVVTTAAA